MTRNRVEPILFTGMNRSGGEERICWIISNAHRANSRTVHVEAGEINFYARKPESKK